MQTPTHSTRRHALTFAAFAVLGMAGTLLAEVPNGAFDATFGNYLPGRSLVQLESENFFPPRAFDIAVLADQRLVIAGSWAGPGTSSTVNMIAARLTASGAVDSAFGDDGIAFFAPPGADGSIAKEVLPLADGKLLLVGYACYADGNEQNCDLVACRLGASGALDSGYADAGCARVGFDLVPDAADLGNAAALDDAGRLVIVATVATDPNDIFAGKAAAVRLTPDGALDTTFGANGRTIILRYEDIVGEPTYEIASAMAIDSDGRILVAGSSYTPADGFDSRDFAVARLTPDGQLDTGFGDGGVVTNNFYGYADAATGVGVQRNGRVVVGGTATTPSFQVFAGFGLTDSGVLDPDFGTMGRFATTFFSDATSLCQDVLIQPDDHIVLVGVAGNLAVGDAGNHLAVARLTPSGVLDTQFGDLTAPPSGRFASSFFLANPTPEAALRAVALQGHRIVASGDAVRFDGELTQGMVVIRLTQDTVFADGFGPPAKQTR